MGLWNSLGGRNCWWSLCWFSNVFVCVVSVFVLGVLFGMGLLVLVRWVVCVWNLVVIVDSLVLRFWISLVMDLFFMFFF